MQDVLSLVNASEIDVSQIAGLQSQLNAKASLQALSLASDAVGAELDGVETQVSALGAVVTSLGSVVASKAAQVSLDATNATVDILNAARVVLQNNLAGTVSSLVSTQQDVAELTTTVSTKADAIALNAVSSTLTNQLNIVSSLLGTRASASGLTALATVVAGKQDNLGATLALDELQLSSENVTLSSGLFRLSGAAGVFSLQRFINESYVPLLSFQHNSSTGENRVICNSEFRASSIGGLLDLTVLNTLSAGQVIAPNLYTRSDVDGLFGSWISTLPAGALPAEKTLGLPEALIRLEDVIEHSNLVQSLVADLTVDLETKQDVLSDSLTLGDLTLSGDSSAGVISHNAGVALTASGSTVAVFEPAGTTIRKLTVQENLSCTGELDVRSSTNLAKIGNGAQFLRVNSGHHIDAMLHSNNQGRSLYIQFYADQNLRIGNSQCRLGVCRDPSYPLDVTGIGRFSGSVQALSYTSTSDARIKEDVLPLSLEECTRLVQTVRPQTYRRTDLGTNERRVGYIAQAWDSQLGPGLRNIVGEALADDGTELLALDYSRICCILHGSLIDALARIEALESRLT
jgi:hypothetical protein